MTNPTLDEVAVPELPTIRERLVAAWDGDVAYSFRLACGDRLGIVLAICPPPLFAPLAPTTRSTSDSEPARRARAAVW
jgi:hypothetical protein